MSVSQSSSILRVPLREDSQLANRGTSFSRKRKSIDDASNHLGESIVIRDASNTSVHELKPKVVIPRAALPLGYIQFNSFAETSRPFTFSAKIWSLENEVDNVATTPSVLIVLNGDNTLGAVERVSRGIYTLHWLAEWVSLEDLGRKPVKKGRTELIKHGRSPSTQDQWWQSVAVRPPPAIQAESNALLDFILADKPRIRDMQSKAQPDNPEVPDAPAALDATIAGTTEETSTDPVDWTIQIRKHYLEALYASRASLAYFVKGPLSRARIAYQSRGEEKSLIDILKATILPVKVRSNAVVIDKKYSKAVVDVINENVHEVGSEGKNEAAGLSSDRISRSTRRKKITSEGLFPGEEEHIISWWTKREISSTHEGLEAGREQRLKCALLEQKFRETQLQIILIMETMALEMQSSLPGSLLNLDTQSGQPQPPMTKEKKALDLPRMLDTLVEKLQIWETMNEDMITFSETSRGALSKNSGSCLRTFCAEIVLPFYMSRLPDVSKDFCYKFGVTLAAEKNNTRRVDMNKIDKNKPGEALKRNPKRRPLDRVLSGEQTRPIRKPAGLLRSATDSLIPLIKEELDEVTLAKIPTARQSIPPSKFYARREVDLTAEVKATEAKMKRKAEIEQQLKGAIFALKKPNARLAVKEYVDASEQRNAPRKGKLRKSQNPIRNTSATGIQVTATPRIRRYRSLADEMVDTHRGTEPEIVPPSSLASIPSSNRKPLGRSLTVPNGSCVFSTPSKVSRTSRAGQNLGNKGSSTDYFSLSTLSDRDVTTPFIEDPASEPDLPGMESNLLQHRALSKPSSKIIIATPVKHNYSTRNSDATSDDSKNAIFTDPVGGVPSSSQGVLPALSPLQTRQLNKEKSDNCENQQPVGATSIYDVLGWDDDILV